MPPQFYLLSTLAEIFRSDSSASRNTPRQRALVQELSGGLFGRMVINPRLVSGYHHDGRQALAFEGDEVRGGKTGRLHRVLMTPVKGGVSAESFTLL